MRRRRRVTGEVLKDRVPLPDTAIWIALSEYCLGAGFVRARDEHKLAADIGIADRRP
jgi:hypothetical protein